MFTKIGTAFMAVEFWDPRVREGSTTFMGGQSVDLNVHVESCHVLGELEQLLFAMEGRDMFAGLNELSICVHR